MSEDDLPQGMVRWHPEINLIAVRQVDGKADGDDKFGSAYEHGWLMVGKSYPGTFYSDSYIKERARRAAAGETDYGDRPEDDRPARPCQWGFSEQNNLRTIDEFITVFDPRTADSSTAAAGGGLV